MYDHYFHEIWLFGLHDVIVIRYKHQVNNFNLLDTVMEIILKCQ